MEKTLPVLRRAHRQRIFIGMDIPSSQYSTISHGATVTRKYGIPAAVGVVVATEHITTSQLITVDGTAGTARIEAAVL